MNPSFASLSDISSYPQNYLLTLKARILNVKPFTCENLYRFAAANTVHFRPTDEKCSGGWGCIIYTVFFRFLFFSIKKLSWNKIYNKSKWFWKDFQIYLVNFLFNTFSDFAHCSWNLFFKRYMGGPWIRIKCSDFDAEK